MARALLQRVLLPPTPDSPPRSPLCIQPHRSCHSQRGKSLSTFRRRLLSYSCIPPDSCPTRSFPNMPLAPSYESVYTTLAHNRRTTRATRPAPWNESCVACVCGTPGSLNTRTQSFLQFSRTSDACYLRLVSVGTRWSRWCPAGTHHRTGSMSGGKAEEEVRWCSVLLLIPLSNHRRPGRSCSARNGASRLILI